MMGKKKAKRRECQHPNVRYTWGLRHHPDGSIAPDVALAAHCVPCGDRLSLGPSNDDIPFEEQVLPTLAKGDLTWSTWEQIEQCESGHDWDVAKPLAEQWPWNEAFANAQLASANAFAGEDSAAVEPWADPSATTQMTDDEITRAVAYSPPGSVQDSKP